MKIDVFLRMIFWLAMFGLFVWAGLDVGAFLWLLLACLVEIEIG